jgi:hypothetical protein
MRLSNVGWALIVLGIWMLLDPRWMPIALEQARSNAPAPYHRGQSAAGWQQGATENAMACNVYFSGDPETLRECLIFTGAAI